MAAAAVASSFSQSINTVKCMRFSQFTADHQHQSLRITSARVSSPISHLHHHSYFTHELFPTAGTVQKRRALKVSAAVAEQEAAVTAPVEESLVEEKGKAEAETEGEVESGMNTKLYFGNLAYNVDSAQLAGIIQDYGTPELVEQYLGRTLRVNFSDKPKPRKPLYPETEFKLFVGNLSWSVTTESLTQGRSYDSMLGRTRVY